MKTAILGLLLLHWFLPAQAQPSYVAYRAETAAPIKIEGDVVAAKVQWSCAGSVCTGKAPDKLNQAEMCRDLARQIGPLKAYQFGAASMDAAQLELCNAGSTLGKPEIALHTTPAIVPPRAVMTPPQKPIRPSAGAATMAPGSPMRPADSARFSPISIGLASATRASVAGFDDYLAASRRYVEMPAAQRTRAYVDSVNARFAEPIRGAITKAAGDPTIAELLQSVQSSSSGCDPGAAAPDSGPGSIASCCSTQQFAPQFEGLTLEGNMGSRSVVPNGAVSQLSATVRGWGLTAQHDLQGSGMRITVPDSARHERVTVTLDTQWVIGLSGLGYAHVWLGLDMQVRSGSGVLCSAPHVEQDNQWTWAGGSLTASDHRPGPRITRTCDFDRTPGDPTDYVVNVSAGSDATFVGTSGGYGDYFVNLGAVDVTSCP